MENLFETKQREEFYAKVADQTITYLKLEVETQAMFEFETKLEPTMREISSQLTSNIPKAQLDSMIECVKNGFVQGAFFGFTKTIEKLYRS